MKIFEEKGYKYQKHLSTGGEGEIHLIKGVDKLFVAKIFDKFDETSFDIINSLKEKDIPNIPQIYELFNHDDKTIIIRDYIEGKTLYEEIEQNGPFDYIKAKSIILKICDTLKSLHNTEPNPIIYRDLKPENIIITPRNEVRLIDFGIARYHKAESTRDTVLAGTKGYTAPEVLAGMQSDNRSDIYSVGLLFYEMLTGKNLLMPPFQIRPVAESDDKLEKWLDIVIEKATDFNQTNRYANIEDFVCDLEHPHKVRKPKKCNPLASAAVIAAAIIVLAGLGYTLLGWDEAPIDEDIPEVIQQSDSEEAQYTSLLELDFDDESDKNYVLTFEDLGSKYEIKDGALNILEQVCEIDFAVESGMAIHYKVMGSEMSSVGLGAFNVTAYSRFESSYYDNNTNTDYAVWELKMQGDPVRGSDDYIDVILYTNEEYTSVYAFTFYADRAAYTAYKIPEYIDSNLYISVCNFQYSQSDFISLDYVNIVEGSIKEYMADNFEGYIENKEIIDSILDKDADALQELPMEEIEY